MARIWRTLATPPAHLSAAHIPIRRDGPLVRRRRDQSTLAGGAVPLFSETSAAAVTCAIMKPELGPAFATRNGAGR